MDWPRLLRHLTMPVWRLRRAFPPGSLAAIEHAIGESESRHGGQIRFAAEHALPPVALWHGQNARQRAVEVFSELRVWDTAHNNGVLIYLLLADRDVEIVADRGIHACVPAAEWEAICRHMEAAFLQGRYEEGALAGIAAVTRLLQQHFPAAGGQADELSNRPALL